MTSTGRLGPTLGDRLAALRHDAAAHAVLLRRILAVLLAALGVALLIRGDPATARVPVVVAGHDLPPGHVIGPADLRTVYRQAGALPDGVLRGAAEVTGHTVAAAMRGGETFTDVRVLGRRLAAAATGRPDARIVPIRLADAGVSDLLHDGDRVDVVATSDTRHEESDGGTGEDRASPDAAPRPTVLADDAVVVLVADPSSGRRGDRVVMLALGPTAATRVAAASLSAALTVVFH